MKARRYRVEAIDEQRHSVSSDYNAPLAALGKMVREKRSVKLDEFTKRINDYFLGFELVELLGITTEDIIEAFPHVIKENTDLLEEVTNYGR